MSTLLVMDNIIKKVAIMVCELITCQVSSNENVYILPIKYGKQFHFCWGGEGVFMLMNCSILRADQRSYVIGSGVSLIGTKLQAVNLAEY